MTMTQNNVAVQQQQVKYPRYFWHQGILCKTANLFDEPMPKPENNFGPIPKDFRYSTRNKDYQKPNSRKLNDRYPRLFDYNEVGSGFYIYPRVVFNEETELYEAVDSKYWGAPLNVGDRTGQWPIEFVTDIYTTHPFTGQPIHVKLPKNDNIKKWHKYKNHQCPTTAVFGAMGEGKSLLINLLENLCLNDEACIMSVDQFFEARHLALVGQLVNIEQIEQFIDSNHPLPEAPNKITKVIILTKVELWLHEQAEVKFVHKKVIERPNIAIKRFSHAIDLIEHLQPNKVLAVYDESFSFISHNKFWFEIAYYLNRRENIDDTVDIVHHESSKLLPSHPFTGQFRDVEYFANEYVAFRKAENRTIFGSQLKGEMFWRTNQKTIYIFYKAGSSTDAVGNTIMKNIITHLAIDETIVQYRGRFSLHIIAKFPELGDMRILKRGADINYGEEVEEQEESEQEKNERLLMQEMPLREEWYNLNQQPQPDDMTATEWKKEKAVNFILLHIFDNDTKLKGILGVDPKTYTNYKAEAHNRYAEIYIQNFKNNPIKINE